MGTFFNSNWFYQEITKPRCKYDLEFSIVYQRVRKYLGVIIMNLYIVLTNFKIQV
jgi:hypothetical protein